MKNITYVKESNRKTLKEYGRGIIGGLLFSLPLVYTSEVWWTGFITAPKYLLCCVFVTYLLLMGYNRYAGMKEGSSFAEICWDSVEEIGLAFVVSFLFLLLISRIEFGMSLEEIAGKVIVESMIVAIGISVGTAQLGGNGDDGDKNEQNLPANRQDGDDVGKKDNPFIKRIILAICGSVLVASAVAPTEEILIIAVSCSALHLLLMLVISLLITGITLYYSDFKKSSGSRPEIMVMLLELMVDYIIALVVGYALLRFFGRVQDYGFTIVVAQMVVLGIAGTIGASAGRLLIGR